MSSTDYVERMNAEVAKITQPLVDQYKELDKEIVAREREVVAMRKARTQLRQMLRGINPELVPAFGNGNGKKKKGGKKAVAGDKVKFFGEWLQAHKDEINDMGGVHASGIINAHGEVGRPGWEDVPIRNQSALSAAFSQLHDQGIVRFDHNGNGGAKFYKVI